MKGADDMYDSSDEVMDGYRNTAPPDASFAGHENPCRCRLCAFFSIKGDHSGKCFRDVNSGGDRYYVHENQTCPGFTYDP